MDQAGLLDKIIEAAAAIDYGRKGFATRGKAEEGRLSFEDGIAESLSAFKDAQSTIDPEIIILAEYTFLAQELHFCDKTNADSLSSLTQAIQGFDDAFLVLKVVEDSTLYKAVDQSIPHNEKYREKKVSPKTLTT